MPEIAGIDPQVPPSGPGCVECDANGGWWVHLRRCAECGHIGCCDPPRHSTPARTPASRGHPFITSFEPGESGSGAPPPTSSTRDRRWLRRNITRSIRPCPDRRPGAAGLEATPALMPSTPDIGSSGRDLQPART